MEPLVHVDKLEITDPEGTNLTADITEEMAQHWARGVYQRGHLYMFPNQATGRFGYSVVDYPAFQGEWLPREPMALANGAIAGTHEPHRLLSALGSDASRTATSRDVKGGGAFGDALREFLQYPNSNDKVSVPRAEPSGLLVALRDRVWHAPEGVPQSARRSKQGNASRSATARA